MGFWHIIYAIYGASNVGESRIVIDIEKNVYINTSNSFNVIISRINSFNTSITQDTVFTTSIFRSCDLSGTIDTINTFEVRTS